MKGGCRGESCSEYSLPRITYFPPLSLVDALCTLTQQTSNRYCLALLTSPLSLYLMFGLDALCTQHLSISAVSQEIFTL